MAGAVGLRGDARLPLTGAANNKLSHPQPLNEAHRSSPQTSSLPRSRQTCAACPPVRCAAALPPPPPATGGSKRRGEGRAASAWGAGRHEGARPERGAIVGGPCSSGARPRPHLEGARGEGADKHNFLGALQQQGWWRERRVRPRDSVHVRTQGGLPALLAPALNNGRCCWHPQTSPSHRRWEITWLMSMNPPQPGILPPGPPKRDTLTLPWAST